MLLMTETGRNAMRPSLIKVHAAASGRFPGLSSRTGPPGGVLVQSAPPGLNRPYGARDNDRFHARLFGFGQDQFSAGTASDRAEM